MSTRILSRLADKKCGDKALSTGARHLTYSELDQQSERLAEKLRRLTVWTEKPVGILAPSGLEFAVALIAVWKAGGIAVPLQPSHPLAELQYQISDTQLSLILADTKCCAEILNRLSGVEVLNIRDSASAPQSPPADARPILRSPPKPEQAALIVYTSGTTNRPKGVVSTYASLNAQIDCLLKAWEWSASDKTVDVLPLHHVHGLVNVLCCSLAAGASCEMIEKFDASTVWQRMEAGAINVFMAVPTIYTRLIQHWESQPAHRRAVLSRAAHGMRLMVSGSAALPQPVFEKWLEITGHRLLERYGMTEIGMALSNPLHGPRKVRTVGLPLPGVEVQLREGGEVHVRGANVFREYWRKPEATNESFTTDGFFKTGDIAECDEDGYYRILGRSSQDIIKSGGYKISALEIESVLLEHPQVYEAAVVGISDETYGERVAAALVLRESANKFDEEFNFLTLWLRDRLAHYKIPTLWRHVSQLPRNAMGKVIKPEVRGLF